MLHPAQRTIAPLPHAGMIVNLEGLVAYVNPAFEAMTGRRAEDIVGRRPTVLYDEEHDATFYDSVLRLVMLGDPWTGQLTGTHASGARLHLALTASPLRDTEGKIAAILCVWRDETERVLAAQAVRESEGLYRQVFQNNRAIKLLIDPVGGSIVDANGAAEQFYGYSRDKLLSMSIQDINVLPRDEVALELKRAAIESRTFFRFPHRLASGELRRVEVYTGPVSYRGRSLLFSIIHDVTARELAEAELALSETRFRDVLRQLPIGVAVHRDERIVYANESAADLIGIDDPATLVGRPIAELAGASSAPGRLGPRGTLPLRREKLKRHDGTAVDAEVRSLPIELKGASATMELVVDASERQRLEEQLRTAQRMEAVGRLAGGVAHDFNNLLFVVLNAARYLLKKMPGDEPLRAEVEQIESAGKRAAELTRQLLLFSRGAEMTAQSVNAQTVITDVERLLRGSLGEHVSLNINPSPLPCFVKVPQPHLEQVLVNLVMNARDAMPSGGVVDIVTSRETNEVGDCVRIVVRDSGSGMTADVIAHAFEPFFSTKEHGRGTGLGLAITYGIIQKADGRITLASEVGKGTTVTIVLPAAAAPGLTPPPPTPRPEDGRGETVLLVEDEDAVRSGVARLLREHHYDVLCARDAADAEERAASIGDIHVLLTDVIMPGLSGPALATRLRAKMPKMRVVFMSGYTGDALAAHGVTDADVLVKPFDEDALLVRLRQVLGSRGR